MKYHGDVFGGICFCLYVCLSLFLFVCL